MEKGPVSRGKSEVIIYFSFSRQGGGKRDTAHFIFYRTMQSLLQSSVSFILKRGAVYVVAQTAQVSVFLDLRNSFSRSSTAPILKFVKIMVGFLKLRIFFSLLVPFSVSLLVYFSLSRIHRDRDRQRRTNGKTAGKKTEPN